MKYLNTKWKSEIQKHKVMGYFLQHFIAEDSIVFTLTGEILSAPNKYTIEIGENQHIMDDFGIYMNHSSTPSTRIEGFNVVANHDIIPNDEINFDYNESETDMDSPFVTEKGESVSGKLHNLLSRSV